jgi:hypothetical protein
VPHRRFPDRARAPRPSLRRCHSPPHLAHG